ncbi:MAG TPA: hypothetical protein PLM53_14910 [Spirochaetota bacterium]|nr:hypothetical protein [Spirochaetota bacterium]HPC42025.1 hypothetical protein [Spirochaetota bacterium]HPL17884.1 hypothetical protein [Spirochaetota bacterium]HQF09542.1 hypothetical protein [Spirochaetota bacterium]HQH98388.1 hypothetical protein [Spirochaetota bacterium]
MINRNAFISKLTRRFSLRLHMTLILMATAMAGATASKLLLMAGLGNPAIRYPLTVLLAYGVFFIAIKFWLRIVVGAAAVHAKTSGSSLPDLSSLSPSDVSAGGGPSGTGGTFSGGGGKFSGAGASGSYGDAVPASPSSGGSSSGGGSGSFDLDLDEGIGVVIVLIALALFLAAVFGAGAYLIYQAPSILSEVAFDSVLAMTLTGKSKSMMGPEWIGSVFKATWKQFAIIFAVAAAAGITMHLIFPQVTRIAEFAQILMKHL